MKRALIFGISGQDGAYLSRLLLSKGYEVHGTSRDPELQTFGTLSALGVRDRVEVHTASLHEFRNLLRLVTTVEPDEIYNLAGQSSVALSFPQPMESIESITMATLQILEVMRYLKAPIRFYNAGSSECFGDIAAGSASDETTAFHPRSPYAVAKAAAHWATANYRDAYQLYACSGILFNHESPLRPRRFVTRKIVTSAQRIAAGEKLKLELGDLAVSRDWGYAPEYVEAMWLMLQQPSAEDYVIATGESHPLEELVAGVFAHLGLDWHDHVTINKAFFRPSEIRYSRGNPTKAAERLGWRAETRFAQLIEKLME